MTTPTPTPTLTPTRPAPRFRVLVAILVLVAAATAGITALLMNIFERKAEQRTPYVRLVEVGEDDTDPAKWGKNWPAQLAATRSRSTTAIGAAMPTCSRIRRPRSA
jgi:nitrite reductase (cytochrome c-552)